MSINMQQTKYWPIFPKQIKSIFNLIGLEEECVGSMSILSEFSIENKVENSPKMFRMFGQDYKKILYETKDIDLCNKIIEIVRKDNEI